MAGNEVRITVKAKDEATKPIRDVQDAFERLKRRGVEGFAIGAGAALTAKGFDLLGEAASAAADYMGEAVKGAVEEQASIARLDAALRANVKGWDGNTAAVEDRMKAGYRLGFSDDDLRASMTRLVGATHDVNKALELQAAAQDLARLKGVSLEAASIALVKVEGGQYRALKELGIVLKDGATQTEALAAVQQVAAGQAAAYADTLAGKTEQLENRWRDLQDEVGKRAIPVLDRAASGLVDLAQASDGAADSSQKLETGVVSLASAWGQLLGDDRTRTYWKNVADSLDELDRRAAQAASALERARARWQAYKRAQNEARLGAVAVNGSLKVLGERLGDVSAAAADGAYRLDAFGDSIAEVTAKATDDQFALDELTSQYRLNTMAIADDVAKIKALEKVKHPTREQRADLEETRLKLIEDKKEAVLLGTKLLAAGKVKYSALIDRLSDLGVELRDENGHANALLQTLRYISGESGYGGGGVSRTYTHRAAGGPVQAGQAYVVGEKRPELFVPSTSGTILPSVPQSAGGGVTVNVSVSAPVLTPGAAQAVADAIAPAITRWQQRRGL